MTRELLKSSHTVQKLYRKSCNRMEGDPAKVRYCTYRNYYNKLNLKHTSDVHNYSTRQAKTIRLLRHRLRSTSSSVSVKGPEVWNTL